MNKIFRYSIAGAIALTQSVAMEITENTIIKSGEAFDWQGETEITIPAGKSLNIAGKMNGPGSPATIYLDGTFEAESGATLDLKNVTIKSKFLEDYPDLEQQEAWDGVPIYQYSSKNFPKFEDAFYKPLTGKRLKVLNKLAGYSDWYEVAVLGDESSEDTDGQALSKIEELRQNLENLQQQIDDFYNAMDNLNGNDIATFAALNAQLAQAAVMYSNENPYVNIDSDAKFILNKYAEFCQKDAEASANYTAEDKLNEPYAFCSAFQSFCWSFLSWKTASLYDSSELSKRIRELYKNTRESLTNYHGSESGIEDRQLEINEYEGTVFVWRNKLTKEEEDLNLTVKDNLFPAESNGTKYYQTIHCHWIGDFTTEDKADWTYNGNGTFSAYTSGNTYSYDINTTTFTHNSDHWTLSLTHLQDIILGIQAILPSVEDSKSNQELQQLTARYYSTTPLSTDGEVTNKTAYTIASQSTINLSKFRTIPILLNSDSVESSKDPLDLTSKVQNLDIESCLTVQLPFNSKFPATTFKEKIWNVTYQTLLTGATKNFEIGDDNVLTYTLSGGTEIGDYETNSDLQITLNPKKTKKNRPHF